MSYVEPIADKVSPKAIKFFSKPLLTIFVVGTVALVALGPLGYMISEAISTGIQALETVSPWIVPLLIGAFTPLFVATGTHYGLVPIGINNRMTTGYDTVIYLACWLQTSVRELQLSALVLNQKILRSNNWHFLLV